MNRRKFTSSVVMAASTPFLVNLPSSQKRKKAKRIKPPALKKGDLVGLIAPASAIKPGQLDRAIAQVEQMGFRVKLGKYAEARYGDFAGNDMERLEDLNNMLSDDNINAIWCIRGGYGLGRMMPMLKKKYLLNRPKLIIGYSDVTALNQYAATIGLVTVHGQVAGDVMTPEVKENMGKVVFGKLSGEIIKPLPDSEQYTIIKGKVSGQLTGGNLSLLSAAAGTPYLDSFKNKIVFIEDLGERPYRIDRMLTQLIQATDLSKAKGIALGAFADCEYSDPNNKAFSLKETLIDQLKPLGIPVCYGIPFGHVDRNLAMPLMINATLDSDQITLQYNEEAVTTR